MKIEYICHACLLIETEDARIVTDPWFAAPAYCDKWYVFPKPVRTDFIEDVDVVLISHGHEDHLNEPTLKLFPKNAKVFYPYSFFGGAKEYIESMGFADVKECVTFKKYAVSEKTSVTFIINSHDSIMVVESGGKVVVNANDALHSSPEKVIDFYIDALNEKWPDIDVLFCGFGGASYFPNTMHLAGKDDYEISLVREQLFAHNFCRVTKGLEPRVAVPFAADF
ncbi:MAG: MBL fold metallo-hydrolase, partial [Pyrinomonadaceae bacterium]